MKKFKLIGGGARITFHNHGLWQVGMFNDLPKWRGERLELLRI